MVRYPSPTEWQQWVDWLAAGLRGRNRWRWALLITGILFARGGRTVTTWLRAAGITTHFMSYYYFLQLLGRKTKAIAERLLALLLVQLWSDRVPVAVEDSPTKRYGPKVQGAGIHRNPSPGPAEQKFVYGQMGVTPFLVVRHPLWNTIGLPLLGLL